MSDPYELQDVNIRNVSPLTAPEALKEIFSVSEQTRRTIYSAREDVKNILAGRDKRVVAIIGPCSIHNADNAIEFGTKLAELAEEVRDRILVVMRVYFEKPRTTIGWKGLINDPHLNGTFDMATGLQMAREILLEITSRGMMAATEMLEPITPQYIADLITIASIGARTTESPTHRQMASGLSMPVGFKNSTEGSLQVAINAMRAAEAPHSFLGIDHSGKTCVVSTRGNPWGHLILRGGTTGPNYDRKSLADAASMLREADLSPRFVVDCSHANSNKDYRQQHVAWNDVIAQRAAGNDTIVGLMLESNLREGKQALGPDPTVLEYGVSITDGCIGLEETAKLLRTGYAMLKDVV